MEKKKQDRKPARNLSARKLSKKELTSVLGGGIAITLGCCTQGCCHQDSKAEG
ncbi:MAG: hypothetical protein H7138_27930 [Myxococcales bacterium]|nr:hypothetical protein [Myxococcales bacterium]